MTTRERPMDSERGNGDGRTGAVEVTEALEVSTTLGTFVVRGPSALSANAGGTPYFSPSCFRTPARSFGGAEAVTAYKTARSHLETADSVSVESRSGMLTGFRAPCFNGSGDSPIYASAPLYNSPITVHTTGAIPTEKDVDRPVKQDCVDSLTFEVGSPRELDDSTETEMFTLPAGVAMEDEFQENCCMNLDDEKARRNNHKVSYIEPNCCNESKSIVVVDTPLLKGKSFHGSPWGGSPIHCSHSSPDHGQYNSSLVPSRLCEVGGMCAPWWLNGSGSQVGVPTYPDVTTHTSGELPALDKLNRFLIAFNRRATSRVWIIDSPSLLHDTELSTSRLPPEV